MIRLLLTAIAFLLLSAPVLAQTAIPPQRLSLVVIPATGDPMTVPNIASSTISATSATACNLAPATTVPPPPYVNPRTTRVPDPFNAGRECEIAVPTTIAGGLPIPNGDYRMVAVGVSDNCINAPNPAPVTCEGPRTTVVIPFAVVLSARPAALTGLKVTQ